MSRSDNGRSQSKDTRTAQERHAKLLEKHEERMRKVDETLEAVKNRGGRARDKRAGV
jgi:archaellum component FlaC